MYNIKCKKQLRKKMRMIIVIIEIIVVIIGIFVSAFYSIYSQFRVSNIDFSRVEINDIDNEKFVGYNTIAIFGLDSRDINNVGNSDSIIVCVINNDTKEIKLASVYRDTYLKISGSKNKPEYNKCNAAYARYGKEGAITMLNTNLDLNIVDHITLTWASMINIIDFIGGIDINMTREEVFWLNGYQLETARSCGKMRDVFDLPLKNGVQHLNGVQAVSFCRIRYTSGDDFKRTERQRYVAKQIFEKSRTLSIKELSKVVDNSLHLLSTSLSFDKFLKLIMYIRNFKISNTYGFPYSKMTKTIKCGSCVFSTNLVRDVERLHYDLYNDNTYRATATVVSIANVVNYGAVVPAKNVTSKYNRNKYNN